MFVMSLQYLKLVDFEIGQKYLIFFNYRTVDLINNTNLLAKNETMVAGSSKHLLSVCTPFLSMFHSHQCHVTPCLLTVRACLGITVTVMLAYNEAL